MIALAGITVGIAVAGALSVLKRDGEWQANKHLVVFFMLIAGIAALPLSTAVSSHFYAIYLPATLPMLLALAPVFYHYTVARTGVGKSPSVRRVEMCLPAAGLLTAFGYWLLPVADREAMFLYGTLPEGLLPAALALLSFVLVFLWLVSSAVYLGLTLKWLVAFRQKLKTFYSNITHLELRWVDGFILMVVILWAAAAGTVFTDNTGLGLLFSGEVVLGLTIMASLFLLNFSQVNPVASPPDDMEDTDEVEPETAGKYTRSALSPDYAETLATRIEIAMRDDLLYLDANLSLQKLSRHIGAVPNMVSQTLNEHIGATFFDYVAGWRVKEAKKRLTSSDASVLAIALDVGFNSRSTFYKAFKKETDMTPKAYRELEIKSH